HPRLAPKRIPVAMHRPDERRSARLVADRGAQIRDKAGQARFSHEGAGPECVLELRLRQRPRTMFEEELEQTPRERRQVNGMPFSQHLPSVGIEETGTKGNPHRHRLEKSRKSAGTRQGLGSALGATVILAETPAFTALTRLWRSAGGHGGDHVFPLFSN